jgi:hypothetical protein
VEHEHETRLRGALELRARLRDLRQVSFGHTNLATFSCAMEGERRVQSLDSDLFWGIDDFSIASRTVGEYEEVAVAMARHVSRKRIQKRLHEHWGTSQGQEGGRSGLEKR